jgi:hypothetical protein
MTARPFLLGVSRFLPYAVLAAVNVWSLLAPDLAMGQSIYGAKFEDPPYLAGVPLAVQDGWFGIPPLSPLAAIVSTAHPRQGKQSVQVWGGDLEHQDFINDATGGYYDAIGSYRRTANFDTAGIVRVRISAHVRVDGPATPGVNFFSAALSARAAVVDGDGNVVNSIGVGQIDISSDGHAYAHDGNELVPVFQASAARPFSPSTTLSLPLVAIFSRTSSSRSRISVGLSSSSLAVLAWLRMAAVSSRRTIRLASAAFLASVTLFIRSFMSPGRITSRIPTETISRPRAPARRRTASSRSAGHGVLVGQEGVELARADHARSASCVSR